MTDFSICCRIRLMSAIESSDDRYKDKSYNIINNGQSLQTDNKAIAFTFDKTYSENAEQPRIWQEAELVIQMTIYGGGHALFICYGQTASGKTFTMQGTEKEPGIILRAIDYIEEKIIEE